MRPTLPVVVAVLVAYGSLFPFHFVAPTDVQRTLEMLLADRRLWTSLSDVLGNIALFVPLGATGVWWGATRTSRGYAVLWTVLAGLAFAFVLQVGQIFVPERSAAMADVFWNAVGTVIGAAIALIIEVSGLTSSRRVATPSLVALGLLAFWIVAELAPLVPALDVVGIKRSLKPLLMNPQLDLAAMCYMAAQALVVARLIMALVGPRRGPSVFILVIGAVLLGKLFVEDQTLDFSTVVGFTLSVVIWSAWTSRFNRPMPSGVLLALLLFAYTLQELSPFTFRVTPSSFSWVPFAASLDGSMLANSRAIAGSVFSLTGCVWLMADMGWRVWATSVPLAAWVLLLEWTQRWIPGRTASVTDALLALSAGLLMGRIEMHAGTTTRPPGTTAPVSHEPVSSQPASMRTPAIALAAAVAGIAVGIRLALQLPGVPYNVSELFLDRGSASALVIFAVALIWLGAGPMLMAHWFTRSRRPFIVLPFAAIIASMISRTLLKYSVTYESLDDILGSSNLFSQVTRENLWGDFWRHAFLVTNVPDLVEYFERRMRYTALYSPLLIFLALAIFLIARIGRRRAAMNWIQLCFLGVTAAVWLWISKIIVINWADTDNLTELIARNGPLNLGGLPFLYLLVVLLAVNVAVLVRAANRPSWWPAAIAFSIIAIPVGWVLLGAGLEQHVDKGFFFSGTQFLLGPNREHTLSDVVLFVRWTIVQAGGVAVMFAGAWIAHRFALRFTSS